LRGFAIGRRAGTLPGSRSFVSSSLVSGPRALVGRRAFHAQTGPQVRLCASILRRSGGAGSRPRPGILLAVSLSLRLGSSGLALRARGVRLAVPGDAPMTSFGTARVAMSAHARVPESSSGALTSYDRGSRRDLGRGRAAQSLLASLRGLFDGLGRPTLSQLPQRRLILVQLLLPFLEATLTIQLELSLLIELLSGLLRLHIGLVGSLRVLAG